MFSATTTVVVLSILPRFSTRLNLVIAATNLLLATKYRSGDRRVRFLDLTPEFVQEDNPSGLHEEFYMPDLLHPSTVGYKKIVELLIPLLQ